MFQWHHNDSTLGHDIISGESRRIAKVCPGAETFENLCVTAKGGGTKRGNCRFIIMGGGGLTWGQVCRCRKCRERKVQLQPRNAMAFNQCQAPTQADGAASGSAGLAAGKRIWGREKEGELGGQWEVRPFEGVGLWWWPGQADLGLLDSPLAKQNVLFHWQMQDAAEVTLVPRLLWAVQNWAAPFDGQVRLFYFPWPFAVHSHATSSKFHLLLL